jgi:uncharacterized protein YjbJ (UPF0337 family)
MSPYVIFGRFTQLKGKTKVTLGKLTGNQVMMVSGEKERIAGELQAKYTLNFDETETIRDWNLS